MGGETDQERAGCKTGRRCMGVWATGRVWASQAMKCRQAYGRIRVGTGLEGPGVETEAGARLYGRRNAYKTCPV